MEDYTGSPELYLFLASTMHDMKDSVSLVSGTLEAMLAASPDLASPQLAHMLYQTKRLNDNLIQLLALYKRVGKPGYPFDSRPQQISELVAQVVAQEKTLLDARSITFETTFPPDLIWSFDEDLIIGVLGHVINNASRYTRGIIRLSIAQFGDYLELRIEDNGQGFPPALLMAGAAAMHGLRAGVNFSTNSTGLGLYFSFQVALMHKHRERSGSITLENGGALGGGCFILRLP